MRRKTLEILLQSHRAMGAYDILEKLEAAGFGNQPPVVYRALEFLVDNGFVHRIRRLNAFTACMHPDRVHTPAFFICRGCDTIAEAAGSDLRQAADKAAKALGFDVEKTTIEALGLCPACQESA